MIHVMGGLFIPESEVRFTTARSGGPGGQNVNKVSSKVTLIFDVSNSGALSDEQKRSIATRLASRINKDGLLQIVSQRTRSQDLNRADVLERFSDLLRRALTPKRPRIRTHVPAAANRQRVEEKKKRGLTKQARSRKAWDT
jgi:ribosome-associated protein